MRNFSFAIVFTLFCFVGYTQSQQGIFDTEQYPEVSFAWNEYNPDVKNKAQFILSQDGNKTDFTIECLASKANNKNKTILFLWEDVNHEKHKGQFDFSRQFLFYFFKEKIISKGDKFNVAIFDRKGVGEDKAIHKFLCNGFSNNLDTLQQKVSNYAPSYNKTSNYEATDLYRAVDEGLDVLKKEPADNIRMLVVISYGVNFNGVGGKNDTDDSENDALNAKIPVSLIEVNPFEASTWSSSIVEDTYGCHIKTENYKDAVIDFSNYYNEVSKIHSGQDYKIKFVSDKKRDKKAYPISLSVDGEEYTLYFTTPAFSLKIWIKENSTTFIGIIAGLFLIAGIILWLIIRKINKNKILRAQEKIEIEQKQDLIQKEAEGTKKELDNYKNSIKHEKKQLLIKQQKKEEQEHYDSMLGLMNSKNLIPRLKCDLGSENLDFSIDKPFVSIGRTLDNDLYLNNKTISKKHAVIEFTGGAFEIKDLDSTNKVVVNGNIVKHATLKDSDIIGLGEVIITFYL